jgi:glycosyltransferase involved in cell wall biosynthesis
VWQRPQQILSRLAQRRPVYFVEEPLFLSVETLRPFLAVRPEEEGRLTVIQPHLPLQEEALPEVSAHNQETARNLLSWHLRAIKLKNAIRWHYAPIALYLKACCPGRPVVYDCMDELSAFKGAPPGLIECERQLLREADVVLTGGRSIYLNKREHNPNTHRFDSGVDVEHFQRAARPETPIPEDARRLAHPVIGYYGVIDERMDYEAIAALAEAFPGGTVLLVGPLTKVREADLPRARNLVYTGQRSYAELPGYLKAFDVALVPFADSAATRFLSPTKTLEYFAGLKPVVSSPIADVVENYGDIVRIVRTPAEYVAAVVSALADDNRERAQAGLARAREMSWDAIVEQIEGLLAEVIEKRGR